MSDTVKIHCENTGSSLFVRRGTTLLEVLEILSLKSESGQPFLAAYVNNRLTELDFTI